MYSMHLTVHINIVVVGWRDSSVLSSVGHESIDWAWFQHAHGGSQLSVTPVVGDLRLQGTKHLYDTHTYMKAK